MTDWPQRLRLAAALRIAPAAFWRLSVKEWAALTAPPPTATLGRATLDALMAAHPDEGGAAVSPRSCVPLPSPRI